MPLKAWLLHQLLQTARDTRLLLVSFVRLSHLCGTLWSAFAAIVSVTGSKVVHLLRERTIRNILSPLYEGFLSGRLGPLANCEVAFWLCNARLLATFLSLFDRFLLVLLYLNI